jgi:hypothetical protein
LRQRHRRTSRQDSDGTWFGQQPRFIVTIQPSGALFNPPAPITIPNVDGLAPRVVTEMYSFDHDIGSFVAIGTGTVSADGQVIASNAGVGVLKAGWHCGGNPGAIGTAADCPVCQWCQGPQGGGAPGGSCIANPNQDGQSVPSNPNQCCFDGQAIAKFGQTFNILENQCPNRTQSSTPYFVDGCSTNLFGPGGVQDPMVQIWLVAHPGQPLLNVADSSGVPISTAFGAFQGNLTSPGQALNLPCNQHDICYQTCQTGDPAVAQGFCDNGLLSAARSVCQAAYPAMCPYDFVTCNQIGGYYDQQNACLGYAQTYYSAVRAVTFFGNNSAAKNDQQMYCQCCQ